MQNEWVSISEYARRFNLSEITVRRRIKQGRIHAELKNGKYFISSPSSASIAKANTLSPSSASSDSPTAASLPMIPATPITEPSEQVSIKNSAAINELAEICKSYLTELKSKEALTQKTHNAEIEIYKIQIEKLDHEIVALRQQVDDLQLLIKMLDNKQ